MAGLLETATSKVPKLPSAFSRITCNICSLCNTLGTRQAKCPCQNSAIFSRKKSGVVLISCNQARFRFFTPSRCSFCSCFFSSAVNCKNRLLRDGNCSRNCLPSSVCNIVGVDECWRSRVFTTCFSDLDCHCRRVCLSMPKPALQARCWYFHNGSAAEWVAICHGSDASMTCLNEKSLTLKRLP